MLRKKAVICGVALMAVTLLIPDNSIKTLLTLGAVFQTVMILPITYKILKRSERNYEEYELKCR
jgi:accessory gene regulator B